MLLEAILVLSVTTPGSACADLRGADALVEAFLATAEGSSTRSELLSELQGQREACLAVVRERAGTGMLREDRSSLLQVLAALGSGAEVELAVALGRPPEGADRSPLDRSLLLTLRSILARDEGALAHLLPVLASVDLDLASLLVRELDGGDPAGILELLGDLLDERSDLTPVLLARIGRLAAGTQVPLEEDLRLAVRNRLSYPDQEVRRQAIFAVGRLEDHEAVVELVEVLGDEGHHVAEAAHWSLRTLTGLSFPRDQERWSSWMAAEELWYENGFDELLEDVL